MTTAQHFRASAVFYRPSHDFFIPPRLSVAGAHARELRNGLSAAVEKARKLTLHMILCSERSQE